MAHTAPSMDSCEMPDATYQPQHSEWPHSSPTFSAELAFQPNQEPISDYSAQNLPAAGWEASWPSGGLSGAIGDLSGYFGATVEHAHPGGDGEVAMEVQSNECDAVSSRTKTECRKPKRSKDWIEPETEVLLKCKEAWFEDVRSRYRKLEGKDPANWNAIAEAVRDTCRGSEKTGDQCRRRWDTLVNSYQLIKKRCHQLIEERGEVTGQEYVEVLAEDTRNWRKLSPSLKRKLYVVIDRIIQSKNGDGPVSAGMARAEAGLHALNLEGGPALGAGSIPAAPGGPGMSKPQALQRFWSLVPRLRTTLLDLFLYERLRMRFHDMDHFGLLESPSGTCEWLSAVQNRSRKDVYNDVCTLVTMRLLQVNNGEEEDEEGVGAYVELEWSLFRELRKFVQKLMRENPALDTHRCLESLDRLKELPSARELLTPPRILRVLTLYACDVLESIDLKCLPKLRSLTVLRCPVLKKITGWKYLKELGWLEISSCGANASYPDLRDLPSLRVCSLTGWLRSDTVDPVGHTFDISRCVRLRRLEIFHDIALKESGDLSSLKCLEELRFHCFSELSTVVGLSELHSLTRLELYACFALSTVDGLSELHSLTRLELGNCKALRSLPDIGHMIELVHIDISFTSVEKIPGIGKLVSLKRVVCEGSKLNYLPDLHHLPELQKVCLEETPLTLQDGTFYSGKEEMVYNLEPERIEVISDGSESSDAEDDYELF